MFRIFVMETECRDIDIYEKQIDAKEQYLKHLESYPEDFSIPEGVEMDFHIVTVHDVHNYVNYAVMSFGPRPLTTEEAQMIALDNWCDMLDTGDDETDKYQYDVTEEQLAEMLQNKEKLMKEHQIYGTSRFEPEDYD